MNALRCTVDNCDTGCPDNAYICGRHTKKLRDALERIRELSGELETTIVRQSRIGSDNAGRRSSETLLPFALNPSLLPDSLQNTLTTWARHIAEAKECQIELRPRLYAGPTHRECRHVSCRLVRSPQPVLGQLADWIAGHADWIRRRQEATEMYEEVAYCADEIERMVDRPGERWYAGACDACGTHLYAAQTAAAIKCRECGRSYDVTSRRNQLLALVQDSLAHAELIGRALSELGVPVTSGQISLWWSRGRLERRSKVPNGYDRNGNPRFRHLYRVGDVIDLVNEAAAKKRQKVSA